MAITYTKNIYSMGCYAQIDGQTDVVFTILWQFNGLEDIFTCSIPCATNVPYVAGQPFTPYADLTEIQVSEWIEQYTPPEQMQLWIQSISDNIAKQKEIQYPPLPWEPSV